MPARKKRELSQQLKSLQALLSQQADTGTNKSVLTQHFSRCFSLPAFGAKHSSAVQFYWKCAGINHFRLCVCVSFENQRNELARQHVCKPWCLCLDDYNLTDLWQKQKGNHWYEGPPVILQRATRGRYFTKCHPFIIWTISLFYLNR